MTSPEDPTTSYEPSAAEIARMRSAMPEEACIVDAMILRECTSRWLKVAMVVGNILEKFHSAFPHLPLAYIQARMQELEDTGVLEIAGDVWAMRHSEVRLVDRNDDV